MGLFKKRREQLEAQRKARENEAKAQQIRSQAKLQADQLLRIAQDCANLVNTTKSPAVFFGRYDLMLEKLKELALLEWTGIFDNSKEIPSATVTRLEGFFPTATNAFIDRCFEAAQEKAATLKTAKGKQNAINRCFEDIEKFSNLMTEESIAYLNDLKTKQLSEVTK